ncbi:hypothetical protein VMT65_24430 [Nocardia sp. CDC153]|uniref:hypothetical protein n=1 Tax=Nocardia sp. CDC153 TaxID=3112167 RepID=UPI002DBA9DCF|nr:hypothetical protein [Nocardia sp. CDC153]MEC3956207.1 hypothetical protein [Nocardia sp. CDC153]
MTAAWISDDEIAGMSDEERRELIRRLQPPPERVLPRPEVVKVHRRVRLALMVGGCIALIPWIVYLGFSLPTEYYARHWSMAWIGYDILLVLMMATTAYLGWKRRVMLLLPAFATGILLLVDAWFDIVTAGAGDIWMSIGTAVLGEIPLAGLQISGAIMLLRFLVLAHPLHDPAINPFRTRLPF